MARGTTRTLRIFRPTRIARHIVGVPRYTPHFPLVARMTGMARDARCVALVAPLALESTSRSKQH